MTPSDAIFSSLTICDQIEGDRLMLLRFLLLLES